MKAVAVDTPGTDVAALKLKGVLLKFGKGTYDLAIKVLSDILAEAAKKVLMPR